MIRGWFAKPRVLAYLALASVVANVVIVVTGGAVRLTDSGLGCPTWPTCTGSSLTPSGPYSFHKQVEFTNRTLTFVLAAIAIATLIAAWRRSGSARRDCARRHPGSGGDRWDQRADRPQPVGRRAASDRFDGQHRGDDWCW